MPDHRVGFNRQPRAHACKPLVLVDRYLIYRSSESINVLAPVDDSEDCQVPNFPITLNTDPNSPAVSHAGIRFALTNLCVPRASDVNRIGPMKLEEKIVFWIAGTAISVWGMIVFADYLLRSFWLIMLRESRVIEEGVELFLF